MYNFLKIIHGCEFRIVHENFKFSKVFEITGTDNSLILVIFSKYSNLMVLWFWNICRKPEPSGSLKIQVTAQHCSRPLGTLCGCNQTLSNLWTVKI
jgi:hypothetical protein